MKENIPTIEQLVLRRVHFIFWARRVLSPTAIKLYILGVGSIAIAYYVSIGSVFANMPSILEVKALYHFIISALLRTEAFVQLISLGMFTVSVLFVRDIVSSQVTHQFDRV